MGLAASQARLLFLTARKSDLEFLGQRINQRRLELSAQTMQLLFSNPGAMGAFGGMFPGQISGNGMSGMSPYTMGGMPGQMPGAQNPLGSTIGASLGGALGGLLFNNQTGAGIGEALGGFVGGLFGGNNNQQAQQQQYNNQYNNQYYAQQQAAMRQQQMMQMMMANRQQQGAYMQQRYQEKRDRALQMIQEQDKVLELMLKQVDTQHQAIMTEIDAVKKVIKDNIQSSFKTFM